MSWVDQYNQFEELCERSKLNNKTTYGPAVNIMRYLSVSKTRIPRTSGMRHHQSSPWYGPLSSLEGELLLMSPTV